MWIVVECTLYTMPKFFLPFTWFHFLISFHLKSIVDIGRAKKLCLADNCTGTATLFWTILQTLFGRCCIQTKIGPKKL